MTDFSLARATMEKVFLRIAGGEEGLAQSRLGREIAEMLQAEADDDAQKELDAVVCVEINQCVGCTRQFFTKSFLGIDVAVLGPASGEEPASPRHRAGVASMARRTTR